MTRHQFKIESHDTNEWWKSKIALIHATTIMQVSDYSFDVMGKVFRKVRIMRPNCHLFFLCFFFTAFYANTKTRLRNIRRLPWFNAYSSYGYLPNPSATSKMRHVQIGYSLTKAKETNLLNYLLIVSSRRVH